MTQPLFQPPAGPLAPPPAARPKPPPQQVVPQPGSLLDELMDQFEAAKARAEEAEALRKALADRIKNEVTAATGGYPAVVIAGNAHRPAYRLTQKDKPGSFRRADFAQDYPQLHTLYWTPGSAKDATWDLRAA